MESPLSDLRYALRSLTKTPGFTVISILSLTLGIGLSAAAFSFVEAMFLRSWPARDPGRLARIVASTQRGQEDRFSYAEYRDIATQASGFSGVLAFARHGRFIGPPSDSRFILVDVVSPNYFSVLGLAPHIGVDFAPRAGGATAGPRVILSDSVWQRDFGGDRSLPGRTIMMSGKSYTVEGVASPGFRGLDKLVPTDAWIPATDEDPQAEAGQRDLLDFELVGRMRTGVTAVQARTELGVIGARLAAQYPQTDKGRDLTLISEKQRLRQSLPGALLLMAGAGLLLLISCANVAALNMARAEGRKKEIAIRTALGARWSRLARFLLAEGLLLSFSGALLGLFLTWVLIRVQGSFMPPAIVELHADMRLGLPVVSFTLLVTLASTLAFSLLPLVGARRSDLVSDLKAEPGAGGQGRAITGRSLLVTAQIAICVVLLSGSGLLLRSVIASTELRPGFDTGRNLALLNVSPSLAGYNGQRSLNFMEELATRAAALPGVKQASFARRAPLSPSGGGATVKVSVPGTMNANDLMNVQIKYNAVAPGYFAAMGTRILQGRDFTAADAAGAERVVLINRTMARRYWPDAGAVGRHLIIEGKDCQVIGVTENAAINSIHEAPEPYIYASFAQMPAEEATLIVETTRDAADSVPALRELVRSLDAKVRIPQVLTMRQLMHFVLWQERMAAGLGGTLSLMGIFLAVAGLYGVIAYFVFRRVREIGVRIALGARPFHVLRIVLGYGLRLALAGTLIGLIAAASATRVLAAYLYGVSATDPLTFGAACLIVIAFALAAGFVPARRACKVDPMLALRCE